MERKKALIASAIVAATLTTGAVAFAAVTVTNAPQDNVGNLQPVTPRTLTVYVDPTTGSVTQPSVAPVPWTRSNEDDHEGDDSEDEYEGGEDDD